MSRCTFGLYFLVCWSFIGRAEMTLFRGALIETVSGKSIPNADLLIENGKIKAVGQSLETKADREINLAGKRIYPGLIAAGTSAGLVEIEMVRATVDLREVGEFTPDVRSWIAVNPDSELLPVVRANGITHIVPAPTGGTVSGLSGVVALHGWTIEDMTIKSPIALHLFWPAMRLDATPREGLRDRSRFKSLEEQARERTAKLKEVDDFFSEAESYAKMPAQNATSPVPAWEAMLPFVQGKVPLMIHADDYRQIKAAVEWAAERKYKIIIAGARDAWMLADLLAREKVPVLFERVYQQGSSSAATPARDVDSYDVHFKAPALLHKAGVKLALGAGLGGDGATELRNLPFIAAQAAAFGLSQEEAVRAITLHPAEILGIADRLGSIETGKEATFVITDGNILDIRTQVLEVWIAGEKTSIESRHTRLYEKYKNRPKKNS
jgi:imidazolonepropionase-like amidohydrolase